MAQARSGGGINSSVVKNVGIQGGSRTTQPVSPRGVSQFGYSPGSTLSKTGAFTTQNSALPVFEAKKPNPVPFGNQLATNVGPGGVGTGRVVMKSGTQGQHGAAAGPQPVQGRDIFGQFPSSQSQGSPGSFVQKR
jgi:hypothetical protein